MPIQSPDARSPRNSVALVLYWLRDLLLAVVIVIFIGLFLYQPVKVEGTSMMPALIDQERIFINKFAYRLNLPTSSAATWSCSGSRATRANRTSSG